MPPPLASPRHPQSLGFVPLSNQMDPEADIPLARLRTGSSFGARKASQGDVGVAVETDSVDEKRGMFHHPSRREQIAGRRRIVKHDTTPVKRSMTEPEIALNFMGKLYTRVVRAPVVTRYLIYVIPVALLLAVPLIVLPLTDNTNTLPLGRVTDDSTTPTTVTNGPPLFHLFIWLEVLWASLWAAKLVAHLVPTVFMFFCGVVSSGTRKYATVLRSLEIPLSLFFWALASWLVFRFLFPSNAFDWVYVIKQIFGSLFVSSAVFLVEKAIVQLISISYHQRSFANRIKASKHDIHLLGLMYEASRTLFPMYCAEFAEDDYIINDSIEAMLTSGRRGHHKAGPAAPMRIIGNVGRIGDKVTSVFGNLASEITGKQVFNPNSAHSIVVEALEKVRSSEAMGRRIWMSFAVEDRDTLSLEDIEEVLGPAHKQEAEECFAAIDADGNGDISLDEMVRKVVELGKERKAISHSMKDIGQALAVFDHVLLFVVLLITIFIFLAFFQSSFISTLTTAGTTLLSLSFIFSVTSQEFLGSCIFLFVKHPYDVGDRVDINGPEKEQLIVEKISLLYTAFLRIDRMVVVQVPNIQLNNLWIENVSRSDAMREVLDVNVAYDTSFDDIELLRLEMEKFVRNPDNARDFQPDLTISVGAVNDLDKLTLKVAIKHKSNWHNDAVRATRRNKFMCALAQALKKVPIQGPGGGGDAAGGPDNPTYSVTVTDAEAAAARKKSAREKNAKRLVPLSDSSDSDSDSDTDKDSHHGKTSRSAEKQAAHDMADAAEGWDYNTLGGSQPPSRRGSSPDSRRHLALPTKSVSKASSKSASKASSKLLRQPTQTQSQRGRRQAGARVASSALDHVDADANSDIGGDSASATAYVSPIVRRTTAASYRSAMSYDVERTAGDSGMESNRFAIPLPPMAGPAGASASSVSAASASQASSARHPLQSAPNDLSATSSRPRGASTSRPLRQ